MRKKSVVTMVMATVLTALTQGVAEPAHAASPGKNGLLLVYRHSDLYTVRLDGTHQTRLTYDHQSGDGQWSPDGRWIAFGSWRDGNENIYVMRADGTDVRQVTTATSREWSPTWSPDGSQLAFVSDRKGAWDVYRLASQKPYGKARRITKGGTVPGGEEESHYVQSVRWNPVTNQIMTWEGVVYTNEIDGDLLCLYDAATGKSVPSWRSIVGGAPDWSPDGTAFAFTDEMDPEYSSWVKWRTVDDATEHDVTDSESGSGAAAWSPDGTLIAYADDGYVRVARPDGSDVRTVAKGVPLSWQPQPEGT